MKNLLNGYLKVVTKEGRTDFMRRLINKQTNGDDLIQAYGSFWFWTGFVGGRILGLVGLLSDALVLFGVFLWITSNYHAAWMISAVICLLIQLYMGSSVTLTVWAIYTGKTKVISYRRMLIITSAFGLAMLASSLYISTHNEYVVSAAKAPPKIISLADIQVRYKDEIQNKVISFDMDVDNTEKEYDEITKNIQFQAKEYKKNTQERISRLKRQGVEYGWLITEMAKRHAEYTRQIAQNLENKKNALSLIREQKRGVMVALDSLQRAEISSAMSENQETILEYRAGVSYWGRFVKYGNFVINLGRVIVLVFFTIFILDAKKEIDTAAKKVSPGQPKYQPVSFTQGAQTRVAPTTPPTRGFDTENLTHDTTPVDGDTKANKEDEVKEKIVVVTKDIGGIKKAARRSYELYFRHSQAALGPDRSKAERSKALAEANLNRYYDRKRELTALGYKTLVRPGQPDKLDFEEIKD